MFIRPPRAGYHHSRWRGRYVSFHPGCIFLMPILPQNLFPVQIENVLTAHPGIQEAAAVAVPDARYGEVVGAWIVRQPGEERISAQEVRECVALNMNSQVSVYRCHVTAIRGGHVLRRTPQSGSGSSKGTLFTRTCPRLQVGKS